MEVAVGIRLPVGSGTAMAVHVRHAPSGHDVPGQHRDSTVGIRKPPRAGRVPKGYKWRRLVHLVDRAVPRIANPKNVTQFAGMGD